MTRKAALQLSGLVPLLIGVAALDCSPASIRSILPANATVNYVVAISEGDSFGDADNQPFPARDLPAGCAVGFSAPSSASASASSSLNVALLLPDDWNGRFMASGSGGFMGYTTWPDMAFYARYGFASMSTNSGHTSIADGAEWALNNPEAVVDWAHRGIHVATAYSKAVVRGYYGSPVNYSYFTGCSNGGRQGLRQIGLYPETFDGALIGAPAWQMSRLMGWATQMGMWNLPGDGPGHIPAATLSRIAEEQIRQCDPRDGVADGIVMDPSACRECLPAALRCGRANRTTGDCLTPPQFRTWARLSRNWTDARGSLVFPTFAVGTDFSTVAGVETAPAEMATSFFKNMVLNNSAWDWRGFGWDTLRLAERINPGGMDVTDFDLSPFASRGGKLIMYHGLADQLIPAGSSTVFYERVRRAMGGNGGGGGRGSGSGSGSGAAVDAFFRLYMMPGVRHCSGSVGGAPWSIAAANQGYWGSRNTGPGYVDDERHNALLALVRWTERGIAPEEIVASKFVLDSAASGVVRQRPLCPYPRSAVYVGGDVDRETSWECRP